MLNDIEKKARIDRFLKDERMSESVYSSLLESFLKPVKSDNDKYLAASRIAIDLLQQAWRDLERYRSQDEQSVNKTKQVGL